MSQQLIHTLRENLLPARYMVLFYCDDPYQFSITFFIQASTSQLTAEIKSLNDEHLQEKSRQEHSLGQEREKLRLHLNEMQARILDHQNSMSSLQEEYEKTKGESKSLQEQLSTLSSQLCEKEKEVNTLKEELVLHEDKLHGAAGSNGEQVPQFEEMVRRLEEKGKEGDRELAAVRAELERTKLQEETLRAKCSQMEISLAKNSKDHDTSMGSSELETTLTLVKGDLNSDLETTLTQVRGDLNSCKLAIERKKVELSDAVTAQSNLTALLEVREEEIKSLRGTLEEAKALISKLRLDKEEAVKQEEALRMANTSLKADMSTLESKLQSVEGEGGLLKKKDDRVQAVELENAKCTKQLANLKNHLIEVRT